MTRDANHILAVHNKTYGLRSLIGSCGIVLVVLGLLTSNEMVESVFRGTMNGSLVWWGPALFRALLCVHGLVLVATAVGSAQHGHHRQSPGQSLLPRDQQDHVANKAKRNGWLAVLGISTVALMLRLWQLDSGLWIDEILTLVDFVRPPIGHIMSSFPSQNQHMLYSVFGHTTIQIFGEHAWAIRLPAVIFGIGSIGALFGLGRRLVGTGEALTACALMAVSYHHIWFSQNARGYTGLLFFATSATWFWIEALPRKEWRWWIAYVISVALGMYTHLTMVCVVGSHTLTYLILLRRSDVSHHTTSTIVRLGSRLNPLLALALCVSVTLQLYALALPDFLRIAFHEVSLKSQWTNLWWPIKETIKGFQISHLTSTPLVFGALLVAIGWLSICRRNWVAAIAMAFPGILVCTIMVVLGHNLWPRFLFFCMAFGILCTVHGAMAAPRSLLGSFVKYPFGDRIPTNVGIALCALMIVGSIITVPRCYVTPKQDFIGARDYVEEMIAPGEIVVTVGLAGIAYQRYYAPQWQMIDSLIELEAIHCDHSGVWLVYTLPIHVQTYHSDMWQVIQDEFEEVAVFHGTLGDGDVHVCRRRKVPNRAHTSLKT